MKLNWRKYYGLYILGLWSFVLGLQSLGQVALVTPYLQIAPGEELLTLRIYQILQIIFVVGFLSAGVGLWIRRQWGRITFQVMAVIFFIAMAWSTFTLQEENGVVLLMRYGLSVVLPLIYLNLPFVKDKFKS